MSLPSAAEATMYFLVVSTVPVVLLVKAALYSPTYVPLAPTLMLLKSASSGAPVKPETLCSSPS